MTSSPFIPSSAQAAVTTGVPRFAVPKQETPQRQKSATTSTVTRIPSLSSTSTPGIIYSHAIDRVRVIKFFTWSICELFT